MITFYWYHRCSTCKKAKTWLDNQGISYQLVEMIDTPPTQELIEKWMEDNEWPIRRYFNTSGKLYREAGLKDLVGQMTAKEAANKLSQNGMLIKRPILEKDGQVLLGFKEEAYQALVNN